MPVLTSLWIMYSRLNVVVLTALRTCSGRQREQPRERTNGSGRIVRRSGKAAVLVLNPTLSPAEIRTANN